MVIYPELDDECGAKLNAELKPIKYLSNCKFGPTEFVMQILITVVQNGSTQTPTLYGTVLGMGGSRR